MLLRTLLRAISEKSSYSGSLIAFVAKVYQPDQTESKLSFFQCRNRALNLCVAFISSVLLPASYSRVTWTERIARWKQCQGFCPRAFPGASPKEEAIQSAKTFLHTIYYNRNISFTQDTYRKVVSSLRACLNSPSRKLLSRFSEEKAIFHNPPCISTSILPDNDVSRYIVIAFCNPFLLEQIVFRPDPFFYSTCIMWRNMPRTQYVHFRKLWWLTKVRYPIPKLGLSYAYKGIYSFRCCELTLCNVGRSHIWIRNTISSSHNAFHL